MARRICSLCNIRSVGTGKGGAFADPAQAQSMDYCVPCLEQAEWENVHSDNGHQDAGCVAMGWATQAEVDGCWICHPELDTTATATVREGTTRVDAAKTPHRSHAGCKHERTPKARAACRKAGGPKAE